MHLQIRRIEVFCTLENFTCTMIPMACLFVQFEMRFEFVRKINQMERNTNSFAFGNLLTQGSMVNYMLHLIQLNAERQTW